MKKKRKSSRMIKDQNVVFNFIFVKKKAYILNNIKNRYIQQIKEWI